jgi:hypothetical protein
VSLAYSFFFFFFFVDAGGKARQGAEKLRTRDSGQSRTVSAASIRLECVDVGEVQAGVVAGKPEIGRRQVWNRVRGSRSGRAEIRLRVHRTAGVKCERQSCVISSAVSVASTVAPGAAGRARVRPWPVLWSAS